MKDFRPISLCSIAYKCIAKILATRLKLVMPHIIDIAQFAFISGCFITDNISLAHELSRDYGRTNGSVKCVLTIYLHKAFDRIS